MKRKGDAAIPPESLQSKASWHRAQASLPIRRKVRILLELQRQDLPLIQRHRPLLAWEKPWPITPNSTTISNKKKTRFGVSRKFSPGVPPPPPGAPPPKKAHQSAFSPARPPSRGGGPRETLCSRDSGERNFHPRKSRPLRKRGPDVGANTAIGRKSLSDR